MTGMRLGRVENLPMPDTEASFDELQARIAATVAFLERVPAAAVNESQEAEVVLGTGANEKRLSGRDYTLTFALPNFFFHVTTAYDLLRHNGVPLGKRTYLGWE